MNSEQLRTQILAADLVWIPLALAAEQALSKSLGLRQTPLSPLNFLVYVGGAVFGWVLLSEHLHLDGFRSGWRMSAAASRLLLAVAVLMVLLLAVESVSDRYVGRLTLSVFSIFLFLGFLCIRRLALNNILRRYKNDDVRRVVILGSDHLATELASKFRDHPELLCKVIGFLRPEGDLPMDLEAACLEMNRSEIYRQMRRNQVVGQIDGQERDQGKKDQPEKDQPENDRQKKKVAIATVSTVDVVGLLRNCRADELVLAHASISNEILNLVGLCRRHAIRVSLIPQPYELYLSHHRLLDLGGLPLLRLGEEAQASRKIWKRMVDIPLAFVFALIALPIVVVCSALLRFSTGSGFRREIRIGCGGVPFSMLRLNVDRDPSSASRFDHILSDLSISELPQLWNVLRGEMSLVGPRPEGPERAHSYSAWQQQRLSVKPGITGLAQVHGLRERHSSDDKTRHDLQYLLQPTLLKDLSLLVETIWTLAARLATFPGRTLSGDGEALSAPEPVFYSSDRYSSARYSSGSGAESSTQPFPEIYQHAHRTQSGSN
jgi:lipopolysaccharide/colanic/teichoic acid biosynthesis glycosyltransferase